MILGFAHLAINSSNLSDDEIFWSAKGYSCIVTHSKVANHQSKKAFCENYQVLHDIVLLRGKNLWPLELTYHGTTSAENSQLFWSDGVIIVKIPELKKFQSFLAKGLGFKFLKDNYVALDALIPGWSCLIKLIEEDTKPVLLDATGGTCLAFYSNNLEEDIMNLLALGATDCSGVFDLELRERKVSIAMMRMPGGPLLELIKIERSSR